MNWKIRLQKKTFWLTIIPAVLLVAQIVSGWFDYNLAAELITSEASKFVNAVFVVLMILGVVTDPTTAGFKDSKQALNYKKPRRGDK